MTELKESYWKGLTLSVDGKHIGTITDVLTKDLPNIENLHDLGEPKLSFVPLEEISEIITYRSNDDKTAFNNMLRRLREPKCQEKK